MWEKENQPRISILSDLVFLKDPSAFVNHIVEERGLDRDQVMVRVGLDGGQGSFKVYGVNLGDWVRP